MSFWMLDTILKKYIKGSTKAIISSLLLFETKWSIQKDLILKAYLCVILDILLLKKFWITKEVEQSTHAIEFARRTFNKYFFSVLILSPQVKMVSFFIPISKIAIGNTDPPPLILLSTKD